MFFKKIFKPITVIFVLLVWLILSALKSFGIVPDDDEEEGSYP